MSDDESMDLIVPPNRSVTSLRDDPEWGEIVEQIVSELEASEMPDKVIQATEMLLAGFPTYKVAKKLKVRTDTVRRWLSMYPTMAAVVSEGRKLLMKWRMSKMEQQMLTAMERSEEILEARFDGKDDITLEDSIDPKIMQIVAQHSRYIIGLFMGQKMDVTVTHELGSSVMKAREDALDYLARALSDQRDSDEPIEAVYRVVDAKFEDAPMFNELGDPNHGTLAKLDITDEGIQCHICGSRIKYLSNHLQNKHAMSTIDYEKSYLLTEGTIRKAEDEWQK